MGKLMALLAVAASTALALAGTSAAAPPVVNDTVVQKDVTYTQTSVNPCTGNASVETSIGRNTFHITEFADGTIHVLFTMHGTVVNDSVDPAEEDFTAQWTEKSTFNGTNGAAGGTFMFTPLLTGSDGSRVRYHYLGHMTVNANGEVTVDLFRTVEDVDCVNA